MQKVIWDIEVAPNAFLVGLLFEDGSVKQFKAFGKKEKLKDKHIAKLKEIFKENVLVGFNSIKYDSPVMAIMLDGGTCQDAYNASVDLIEQDGKHWHYGTFIKSHIDLMEVAFGQASLKLYGARLNTPKLQDLPYDAHEKHTKKMWKAVAKYNVNDLELTKLLYDELLPQLKIRENIGNKYHVNVMSKSDAQIAEAVFKKALKLDKKLKIDKPDEVYYKAPDYVKFKTKELQELKEKFESATYTINKKTGNFNPQEWLKEKVVIAGVEYTIGFGGLHSNEKSTAYVGRIRNADIASMYPSLIINSGKYPIQLGEKWLELYTNFRDSRMKIKHTDKDLSAVLKIFLNGSFGKLNSIYSILYAPHLMLDTTITGQLSLLMVIEAMALNDIKVLSANTDGLEYVCKNKKGEKIIDKLGKKMNLVWEHAQYNALYSRDVNSYIAVYDEDVKSKGFYADETKNPLAKNPQHPIVQEAIRKFLFDGTPMSMTIRGCADVAQFCISRAVTGGALWSNKSYPDTEEYEEYIKRVPFKQNKALEKRNENYKKEFVLAEADKWYIGKTVRFIYVKNGYPLFYKKSGNTVPLSHGCRPMMQLEKKVPKDLDYEKYIALAEQYLKDLGWEKGNG
jgi:hypothetical protein